MGHCWGYNFCIALNARKGVMTASRISREPLQDLEQESVVKKIYIRGILVLRAGFCSNKHCGGLTNAWCHLPGLPCDRRV